MISPLGMLSGSTAFLIQITGYAIATSCFIRARKKTNSNLIVYGLFFAFMANFFLGPTSDWISVLLTDTNIPPYLIAQLSYILSQPFFALGMYMGFSLLKPAIARRIFFIYLLAGVIYIPALIFFPEANIIPIYGTPPVGQVDLIDIQLMGTLVLFMIIDMLSFAVILVPSFWWVALSKKSKSIPRKKAFFIALGFTLFVLCGIIDITIPLGPYIGYVRIGMAAGYIFLYLGFTS